MALSMLGYIAFWIVFPEPDDRFFAAVPVVTTLLISLAGSQERRGLQFVRVDPG